MYRMIKYSYIIFIAFLVQSCDNVIDGTDKEWLKFKCSDFKVGIEKMDLDIVKFEINKLVKDLKPKVTTRDKFGQKENINLLIERLSTLCNDINTELLCYACIETNPPQSEILVIVDSSGTSVNRVIDIMSPADSNMFCVGIHDYYRN